MPDVGTKRRVGLVVAKLDQHRSVGIPGGERMHRQFAKPAAEVHQVLRADVLVTEDDQLVLRQGILDGVPRRVGNRLAEIDAGNLSAEMDADPRDRETGMLRNDGTALEMLDRLVHALLR
jgi:hypothetical protein